MDRALLRKYNKENYGDNAVLDCNQPPGEDLQSNFRVNVDIAVPAVKNRKSAGVDNIHSNLREEVEIAVSAVKEEGLPELIIYNRIFVRKLILQ